MSPLLRYSDILKQCLERFTTHLSTYMRRSILIEQIFQVISAYLISWDSNLFVVSRFSILYIYSQEQLWDGIKNGTLDMIVSDHSPCVPELKTYGNFLTAWGGISSLQFGIYLSENIEHERKKYYKREKDR